jgi:hypothetical protein
MKKISLFVFLTLCAMSVYAQGIRVQFNTVNGYGNNLYIDNLTIGTQFNTDVAVLSIENIIKDTSYAIGTTSFVVAPKVSFINLGKLNITSSFNVTMTVSPGTYSSTKSISSLASGQSTIVTFDNLTITPGQQINVTVTANLAGDQNPSNNTLTQNSLYLPGFARKVLLEEFTSSTCGPCAANNPTIDAFVHNKFDSLVAIKYHMNWPSPGNDPMYLYNPTQATDRRTYYSVNAVPTVIMDGVVRPEYPYTLPNSLPDAFNSRKTKGTPVNLSVTNTRIPGDTIRADITLTISSPLPAGQYFMRVHAIERVVRYASPPGTNGEKDFYDVFRKAYPNSQGIQIPTAAGTYNYTVKYPLDLQVWVDSLIYTAVFVQNDFTKEVLNAAKSRNYTADNFVYEEPENLSTPKPIVAFDFIESNNAAIIENNNPLISNNFYYELFDGQFPASGWSISNPDGGITFAQFTGANGPSFGGNKSIKMDFYSYSATNQNDYLYSRVFTGLNEFDSLKFDYAHANYPGYTDRLIVKLSLDGGATYPHTIFDKSGASLATAGSSSSSFTPTSASQWATFSYPLMQVIPVELTSFEARANGLDVELNWTTATETNNYGFEIQRKYGEDFITVGFVKGSGHSTSIKKYNFTDKQLNEGAYTYRLKQIDYNGAYHFSQEVEVLVTGPKVYFIEQNYPNPFNPETVIRFNLATSSNVTLKVYNNLGEEIKTLFSGKMNAGRNQVSFDGSGLSSGIYIYRIEAVGDDGTIFTSAKKMNLIK